MNPGIMMSVCPNCHNRPKFYVTNVTNVTNVTSIALLEKNILQVPLAIWKYSSTDRAWYTRDLAGLMSWDNQARLQSISASSNRRYVQPYPFWNTPLGMIYWHTIILPTLIWQQWSGGLPTCSDMY